MSADRPAPIRGPGLAAIVHHHVERSREPARRDVERGYLLIPALSPAAQRALHGLALAESLRELLVGVERAHDRERLRLREQRGGDVTHLVMRDGVDLRQDLLDRLEPRIDKLGLAEPAHPRGRVLKAEHDGAAQLSLAAVKLLISQTRVDY